jgi:RsmE family RNA methyltransferase
VLSASIEALNLFLLQPHEIGADGVATLYDRRAVHAREVLRLSDGDSLRIGVRGGLLGRATVAWDRDEGLSLTIVLDEAPPARPGIDLILAIPRPKALKRVIPAVASLGVDRVVLINAARVEKSYFDAKVLNAAALDALVDLGLEQAKDTVPPQIELRDRFKPFVEDELGEWAGDALRLLPHPSATTPASPQPEDRRLVIAIGPDGGWVPFEVELLVRHGFVPISLGPRILRGEVAVPAVVGAVRPTLACRSATQSAR